MVFTLKAVAEFFLNTRLMYGAMAVPDTRRRCRNVQKTLRHRRFLGLCRWGSAALRLQLSASRFRSIRDTSASACQRAMPTRQTRQHARLKTHQRVSPLDQSASARPPTHQSAARITSHASTSSASLGVSERTHLLRLDDLLVFAAFFRAFGTFERIDTLPACLLYTSPSPRDRQKSRMPSSA